MNTSMHILYALLLLLLYRQVYASSDTIAWNHSITDGDTVISRGGKFALGFFSPGNSSSRYVGVWYHKIPEQTVVWVANRDSPIHDTTGVLSITKQGNLALFNRRNMPVWSTNASVTSSSKSIAQLLDSGNLVILEGHDSRKVIWQSFDYPSNTMLPNLKLGVDKRTGLNWFLTSWKSQDNPGTGTITFRIDPRGSPQLFLYRGQVPLWRERSCTGTEMSKNFIFYANFINNNEEISVSWGIKDPSIFSRMYIDETGVVHRSTWLEKDHRWVEFWSAPKEKCDSYSLCGPNGNCDPTVPPDQFECECLPGFEPKSPRDWFLRDGSGGCIRKKGAALCRHGEGFVKVQHVKVPDTSEVHIDMSLNLAACEDHCLKNCSCMAYTDVDDGKKIGCMTWHGDMVDTKIFPGSRQDLYIRVDAIDLASHPKANDHRGKKALLEIVLSSVFAVLIIVGSVLFAKKRRGERESHRLPSSLLTDTASDFDGSRHDSDLPLFKLSTVVSITDNFSAANKLGEGGFGAVYKGHLDNGVDVAIKRLSQSSGQGMEEFKNEVALIAKLQHRNLVRILGCCVDKEEKIIIYEFLPNKSLDSILFDETKKSLLPWGKRFEIICGVARGILYLHHDSRLRIIHRDLKASNVLLDGEMLPKISDFGMARIFSTNQLEANTNRVVGTYGYMSPEYAMEGLYSTKSDVYGFGVLVLEIITGRKNSSFHEISSSNLVGHVWDSWSEGKTINTVDPSILCNSYEDHDAQIIKCIQIGLLCVQEHAVDRPTMSIVVSMLVSDLPLPDPKQPPFIFKRSNSKEGENSISEEGYSINEMTGSVIFPR